MWCHICSCSPGRPTQAAVRGSDQVSMFGEFQARPVKTLSQKPRWIPQILRLTSALYEMSTYTHFCAHKQKCMCVHTKKGKKNQWLPAKVVGLCLKSQHSEVWGKGSQRTNQSWLLGEVKTSMGCMGCMNIYIWKKEGKGAERIGLILHYSCTHGVNSIWM